MYLIPSDFKKAIQADLLNQVIGADASILDAAQLTAVEEASSYLKQKYILTDEFQDTPAWDKTKIYKGGNRVYLDAPAFSSSATYALGDYVSYSGKIYKAPGAIVADSFKEANWTYVCIQYQIFMAQPPYPVFDVDAIYAAGAQVFYNDSVYTALFASTPVYMPPSIEYVVYKNVPKPNRYPGGTSNQWNDGVAYTVAANTDILNTTYWTMGDNRSQQLVTFVVDITLFHLHSRISPRNIPDLRHDRYDNAIKWLKSCAKGDVTSAMRKLQPASGARIRWGGPIKSQNSY